MREAHPATLASLIVSDHPTPVQEAMLAEFTELLTVCIERLAPPQREILTQRNLLNRSYDEIARTLGIGIGTVKSRIARARESLRAQLAAACPEFAPDSPPGAWLDTARWSGPVETTSI